MTLLIKIMDWTNREEVLKALRQDGYVLHYVDKSFQSDRELVSVAVRQYGLALEFAKGLLQSDKELVMEAVEQNGNALAFADKSLKKDKHIVLEAVRQNGEALEFADNSLKTDEEFLLEAIELSHSSIKFADESLLLDKNFVLKAMKKNILVLHYVNDSFIMDVFTYGYEYTRNLSGKELNYLFPNEQFRKKIHANMCMKGFQYKIGINRDTLAFNTRNECCPGGLYFTTADFIEKFSDETYGKTIYGVRIPDEARVYIEGPDKLKADMIEIYHLMTTERINCPIEQDTQVTKKWYYNGKLHEENNSSNSYIEWYRY